MAATPFVQATNTSISPGTSTTTHTVSLPSGIVAGDLLKVFLSFDSNTTITIPGGWTIEENTLNSNIRLIILSKIAAGSDTLVLTSTIGCASVHASYRVVSTDTTIRIGTVATGSGTSADPPSLNNGISQKFLWFAVTTAGANISTYPTNYTDNQLSVSQGNANLKVATRSYESASDDPSAFTVDSIENWIAQTTSVDEQAQVTGSFSLITRASSIFAPSIDFPGDGNFSLLEMNSQIFAPTATASTDTVWTNESTEVTNWTNET